MPQSNMKYGIFILALVAVVLGSCSSIDCPLNNTVYANWRLQGNDTTLVDTLTVSAKRMDGTDTVVVNRLTGTGSFSLPVSYNQSVDELHLAFTGSTGTTTVDTVMISKDNIPHFEAVDCSPNYFHTITGLTTTHHVIDSLVISNPNIDYDATRKHILLYIHPRN